MPPQAIQQAFERAVRHHQSGQFQQAEQLYRQILAQQPKHADALHFLGLLAHQVGQSDTAVDLMRQAIAAKPSYPEAFCNLGVVLRDKGQIDEAIAAFRQSIGLKRNNPEAHSNLGAALSTKGELDEAIAEFRRAISLRPSYPEAHCNLGAALSAQGKMDEAISALRHAITININYPEAHCNLGTALRDKGKLDEAIGAFRRAISLRPNYYEAFSNLGTALKEKGQLDGAVAAYRQAIAIKPSYPDAHSNLGDALREKGRLDEAIAACRQAIAFKPGYANAHNNLGIALRYNGQLDEAIAAFHQAIALKPSYAEAHSNLGNVLRDQGLLDEAIAAFRQAIALKPGYPEAHSNLGNALRDQGQLEEAIAAFRQAIALKPAYPEALNNLGNTLKEKGQLDEAIAAFRQAIALEPGYSEVHSNLGNVLKDQGQLEEAIAACRQAVALDPNKASTGSNLVFTLHFHPAYDNKRIAEEHSRWNQQHAEPLQKFIKPHVNDRSPDRRLRIGYVSPDFREHPVGRFILPLLANHDYQNFEIFAYAQLTRADATTQELRSHIDQWRSIMGLSDEQAAQLIRDDRIDILVDLTMHSANNRLLVFARKPAPVQVTYLAYCSTTGMSAIDYRLSDPHLDPPGQDQSVYSEKTVCLPHNYWCYQPVSSPSVGAVPALKTDHITFGSLNNFCKVTEPTLTTWARLLQAVPNSQLLLHAHEGSHRQRTTELFQRLGVDAERLRFMRQVPMSEYLELYQQIDIALDPFPYGGGTTTCDALWMGVPVVSLAGKTAVGRGGLSILSNIGLSDLVASTPEQYVQIVASLANDLPRLANLRSTLRERMEGSPLMDAVGFARGVEAAYREMWRKWCAGN